MAGAPLSFESCDGFMASPSEAHELYLIQRRRRVATSPPKPINATALGAGTRV